LQIGKDEERGCKV